MSWNDQNNNNGSRDPWGNKNDAPDIDEAIKRFKAIFGPIFGGSSGGGGGKKVGTSKYISYFFVALIVLYGAAGIYTVDAQEEAVILRFGEYTDTKGPGIHWNPPLIDTRSIVINVKLFTDTTNS